MAAAAQQALFAHAVSGNPVSVVPDMVPRLSPGDLIECYTRLKNVQSPAALIVTAEVLEDRFSGYLVSAEEPDYQDVLMELGEPLLFWMPEDEGQAGEDDGVVACTTPY